MLQRFRNPTLSNGMAMFSMFFGAGNITFPLLIGLAVQGGLPSALLGLAITAVIMPFSGLVAITLYDGDYWPFFRRMGSVPGYLSILFLLLLIGPLAGIPRCITLTYSTLKVHFTFLELLPFSALACAGLYFLCWKRNTVVPLIGNVLSPILILFLGAIAVKGLFFTHWEAFELSQITHPFWYGLVQGYNTMDLLAAFFFSTLICERLKAQGETSVVKPVLKAALLGGGLLTLVYLTFSLVAARYHTALANVPLDQLLGTLGHVVLGPYAGLFVSVSIGLTCLTTALALSAICAEFLQDKVFKGKVNFHLCLLMVLVCTLFVCTLEFSGIVNLLLPLLEILYPALIVLSLFNILHKLYDFKPIKVPVYVTVAVVVVLLFSKII